MDTLSTIENLTFTATLRPEVVVDPTSDHALLEATRIGDEDAFAELVSRYRNQITSYIYRIATNLAISELRKRKRRRLVSLTGFFESRDGAEPQEFNPVDDKPLADTELVAAERRQAVQRAISTLPEKYRAPLILRDVDGKSYEEISCILQTSEGTVKSRISRARGFLREKMNAYF